VTKFTRNNLNELFPSVKNPSSKVLSPGESVATTGAVVKPADPDYSWTAAKCILALLQAIVEAIDFRFVPCTMMMYWSC